MSPSTLWAKISAITAGGGGECPEKSFSVLMQLLKIKLVSPGWVGGMWLFNTSYTQPIWLTITMGKQFLLASWSISSFETKWALEGSAALLCPKCTSFWKYLPWAKQKRWFRSLTWMPSLCCCPVTVENPLKPQTAAIPRLPVLYHLRKAGREWTMRGPKF